MESVVTLLNRDEATRPAGWEEISEPCSSLGAQSITTDPRYCTVSTPNSGTQQSILLSRGKFSDSHDCHDSVSDEEYHERVTINLNTGEDLQAKPYNHSVGGHHVMLKQEGKLWKATRSQREEQFYTTIKYCTTKGTMRYSNEDDTDLSIEISNSLNPKHFLGEVIPDEATVRSAVAIQPFVPQFHGMRQVRKLRCQHDQRTPSASTVTVDEAQTFPKSPRTRQTLGGSSHRFDAAGSHTAQDIVATFEHQATEQFVTDVDTTSSAPASTNPALRRTMILPSKAPEEGRPLDHRLPRTADHLVDMIVLEDVCHGFQIPCVLDLKVGTRQYGVNAPESKRRSKTKKAEESTSAKLGLRVTGYKKWNRMSRVFEAKSKRECFQFTPSQVESALFDYFDGDATLISRFRAITQSFEQAFLMQTAFRFFTSSVLLVYDANRPAETARMVMIDFAYTYCHSELVAAGDRDAHAQHDEGYLLGIQSLLCIVEHNLQRALTPISAS